jgi:N-acetylglucosamine kinase-like BadF-type ATPase
VLAAGTPQGWGVALICGTGSIAWARDASGRQARAGGWGYLLGDEGGGFDIGLTALRAILHAADGRGPQTILTDAILDRWALPAPDALVAHVYRPPLPPAEIAVLAPLVNDAAAAGDGVAMTILRRAGQELASLVQAAARDLDMARPLPCALAGGALLRSPALQDAFLAAAGDLGLTLGPVTPVSEPAEGALRLARAAVNAAASG